ncbi:MAG: 30S ribosomal protein S3 [Candidatus Omnitrophota bacterium]
MGQKVHPYILRVGINKDWRSVWYADPKDYAKNIHQDYKIRQYIRKNYGHAAVSYINIERMGDQIKIKIASARPGVIIGRRGADIDRLRSQLGKITTRDLSIDIIEIKNPALDAQLVAQNVAFQLEKRVSFRRAVKRAIDQSIQSGVKGIKIAVAGRLGGAEIARRESYHEGALPLQTLRADVDYGFTEARTTYGVIGVKAWIYHGEVIPKKKKQPQSQKSKA